MGEDREAAASARQVHFYSVESVAREVAARRHPIPCGGGAEADCLAEAWQGWTVSTLLTQLNGYVHDQKVNVVIGGTTTGHDEAFSTPKEQWLVDDAGREALLRLFEEDTVTVWPTFSFPPRPEAVSSLLRLLPSEARILVRQTWNGQSEATSTAADAIDAIEKTMKRQAQGWIRIIEAAALLEEAGRGRASDWRKKLVAAAESGALPMHEPESLDRVVYGTAPPSRESRRARDFYEWVHVDDLNHWLDTNEPRLPFRFKRIVVTPTPPKSEPAVADSSTLASHQGAALHAQSDVAHSGGFVATLLVAPAETVWNTDEVPRLTANALSPVPESEEDPVTALLRVDNKDGRDHYNPLPEADLDTLRAFWKDKGLPPPGTAMNTAQWMPYLLAWNDTSPKPEWQFAVQPARDPFHAARVGRCSIELTHQEQLQKALDAGTIVSRMKGTMVEAPSWVPSSNTVLTRSELTKFCESLCIRVQVSETAGGSLPVEYLWSDAETFTLDEALLLLARPFEAAVLGQPFLLREPAEARKYTEMEAQICRALVAFAERGNVALCDRKSGRRLDFPLPQDQDTTEVVVSRGDLQRFALTKLRLDLRAMESTVQAEQRRIEGYYTLSEVSKSITEERQWPEERRREFLKDMVEAGTTGVLRLRKPLTYGYYTTPPETVRESQDVVSPEDVNSWLPQYGVQFLWRVGVPVNAAEAFKAPPQHANAAPELAAYRNPPQTEAPCQAGKVEDVSAVTSAMPASSPNAPSLSTDEICEAFDKVGMPSQQWRSALERDRPRWLLACRASIGKQGASPVQARWNPLKIAEALVTGKPRKTGVVPLVKVNAAFRNPLLQPFATAWRELVIDNPVWGE